MIHALLKSKLIQNAIYAFITTMLLSGGPRLLAAADPTSDAHQSLKEQTGSKEMKKAAVQAMPRVHFSELKHEFEPVVEGIKVMHDFVIQNQGGAILRIDKVRTSCGCTVTSYPKEIAAGGIGPPESQARRIVIVPSLFQRIARAIDINGRKVGYWLAHRKMDMQTSLMLISITPHRCKYQCKVLYGIM